MTVTKGCALFLSLTLAGAFARASGLAGESPASSIQRLTAISSRVSGKGASLVIEASAPVPYVATRPDPLTVLVDFRNVGAAGLANSVAASAKSPIASVAVEAAESMGAPASRVHITLAQPVGYRVRSDRNTIVVDFDKPSDKAAPYVLPPASRQAAPQDAMKALELLTPAARPRRIRSPRSASASRPARRAAARAAAAARPFARHRRAVAAGRGLGDRASSAAARAADARATSADRDGPQVLRPPDQPRFPGRRIFAPCCASSPRRAG